MYLKERLIGISIYMFVFFLIIMLLSLTNSKKNARYILILYIFIIGIMGYFYLPSQTADLYRIQTLIKMYYSSYTFSDIFETIQRINFQIYPIYYWIFGKIGNVNLLPAITGVWFYSNVFYILYDSSKRNKWSNKILILLLMFVIAGGQFVEVISGIRSMLAFSIVAVCLYNEIYRKKSIYVNLPFYLFAGLLHEAAFVLIGIRILLMLIQKEKKMFLYIKNILLLIIVIIVVFKFGQNTFNSIISRGSSYLTKNIYSNLWEYIIAISCNLFMIYSLIISKKILKQTPNEEMIKLRKISLVYLIIDMLFIIEYSIFHSFRSFVMFLIIPIIGFNFNFIEENNGKYFKKYQKVFYLFIVFTIMLTLVRGNVSGLKFFLFD